MDLDRGKARGRLSRLTGPAVLLPVLGLAGCSGQGARFGLLAPASDRAHYMGDLWFWAWVACFVIGGLVWGLIFYALIRYRRTTSNQVPRQTKYHLPMELLYTLVPILIICVLFVFTVRAQNGVQAMSATPQHRITVIGQKWSWTFEYNEAGNAAIGTDAWEAGTPEKIPVLYLPVNQSVRFDLQSADVIHSFWVPAYYFKRDLIPGQSNAFELTPTKMGDFEGKCAELCGTYHSAMVFKVRVVSVDDYNAYVKKLAAAGNDAATMPKVPVNVTALPIPSKEAGR